ncbi:uncharacterized protein LOC127795650 [Diospyros lotus]|uniref:uncharacterized protein LOC127795650 n=1 Tax=Diospyros lotus TaxID=55363 RepID=UPI002253A305|nr:uncharacterized protein LOC127795650 [Diospyros lotus]
MAAAAPVEVGTRGTVASLVMKEIEYFRRLELDRHGSCRKPQPQNHNTVEAPSGGSSTTTNRPAGFSFLIMATLRRKKRRGGGGFLPSMCSAAEVADCHRLNGIPGFSYRNLKDDLKDSCDI